MAILVYKTPQNYVNILWSKFKVAFPKTEVLGKPRVSVIFSPDRTVKGGKNKEKLADHQGSVNRLH
jgi:hypothetical protein